MDFLYESDEDFMELIQNINKAIEAENNKPAIINPQGIRDFFSCYNNIKKGLDLSSVKLDYKMHEDLKTMGSISIEGTNIKIINNKAFIEACRTASNVEVFPKLDGNIHMNFTYYGLTRSL